MTELEEHIKRLIRAGGPIPLSVYMGLALGHPEYGYYHHREVFGTEGDFITAPEISQIFGEAIGVFVALLALGLAIVSGAARAARASSFCANWGRDAAH